MRQTVAVGVIEATTPKEVAGKASSCGWVVSVKSHLYFHRKEFRRISSAARDVTYYCLYLSKHGTRSHVWAGTWWWVALALLFILSAQPTWCIFICASLRLVNRVDTICYQHLKDCKQ